jgi:hypothetical protein
VNQAQQLLFAPPVPPPPDLDGLRPYQREAVTGILAALRTHRAAMLVMATGLGKCLAPNTLVLLSNGCAIRADSVREGDVLAAPDGGERIVLSTCSGRGPMYRITPTKGEPWECNDVHVLTLVHTETGRTVDIPLNEYLTKSKHWKHCHKLFRAPWAGECVDGRRRLFSPYFLGVLLGDGTIGGTVSICKPDKEIEGAVMDEAHQLDLRVRKDASRPTAPVFFLLDDQTQKGRGHKGRLRVELERLGLWGLDSSDRHVPHGYKHGSWETRREILAGLLDTDGSLVNDGACFDFVSKSRRLADDVMFLARSLGLAAYAKPARKRCQTGAVGDYWRVTISGDTDTIPTRIARKQANPRRQKKNALRTGFKVEAIGEGDYAGFTLDGDGRFLLGDFTVTHNTQTFGAVARHWPGRVLVLAHRDELIEQARRRLALMTGELVGVEQAGYWAGSERIVVGSVQTLGLKRGDRAARIERFAARPFDLVVIDEAHHAPAKTYRTILNAMPSARVLGVTATPDRGDGVAMGEIFQAVAYQRDIREGIDDGYLVPVVARQVQLEKVDLSAVKTTAGDLNLGQLDEEMTRELAGIAHATVEHAGVLHERRGGP